MEVLPAEPAPASHPGVSFSLLGPLEAVRAAGTAGEQVLELGRPKQRAVLALLLLSPGRVVSTDRLIDAIWAGEPPPSALASLQAYVSNLRRVLRDAVGSSTVLVRRPPGYVLEVAPERVDAARFTATVRRAREVLEAENWPEVLQLTEAALAGWRGELLADLADQPWVRAEADALEDLRTECREAHITALLAAGRVAPALAAAGELRAAQPLRDRACWLHVLALHRAGRSVEALEQYRLHAERLDQELGLEPGPELRELQVAVLRHDPALTAWPRAAGAPDAARVTVPAPVRRPADAAAQEPTPEGLVGRARETAMLDEVVADARGGSTRWLVLTGPAGIGKTRLAEELGRRAGAAGGRKAWARCSEEDGAPAWWPVRQLVRGLGADPETLLVPPAGADADEARFALYERVSQLVEASAVGAAPLVLVVDDVQWADRTSVRCLAHLAGALRDAPVVVALTLRAGEDDTALIPLLAALARSPGHRELPVRPLEAAHVAELAGRIVGAALSDHEAGQLTASTGGNPLFVSEFARLPLAERARGAVPLAVRSVLGRRLAGLDPEVLDVLRPAACIGEVLDLPTLAATTGLDADTLADRLDVAADEHVLVPTPGGDGYAFAHGLLRQELLAGLSPLRRQRLHARIARTFAGRDDADAVAHRAQHLVAALPLSDAADVLVACRAAARSAEDRWSSETAADWWAQAVRAFDLQSPADRVASDRDELLVAQVAALARAGRGQTVLDVLDAGLLDALRAGRPATVGRLAASLLRSAGAWPWTSYGEDPGPLIERLASLEPLVAHDAAAHARVLAALAIGRCYDDDPTVPDALSARALERAEEDGTAEVVADALLGRLMTYSGVSSHAEEAIAILTRLEALDHPDRRVDVTIGLSVVSMAQLMLGRADRAEACVAQAIAESDLLGLPVIRVQLRWMEGTLATWRGDLARARQHYAMAGRIHAQTELYYAGSGIVAAHSLAREEGGLADIDPATSPEPLAWGAAVSVARGDREAVEPQLDAWVSGLTSWTWTTLGHLALLGHVAADAELAGQAPRLLALLTPHGGRVAVIGHIGVIDPVDLVRGRLEQLAGNTDAARALFTAALEQAEAAGGAPSSRRARAALAGLAPPD